MIAFLKTEVDAFVRRDIFETEQDFGNRITIIAESSPTFAECRKLLARHLSVDHDLLSLSFQNRKCVLLLTRKTS